MTDIPPSPESSSPSSKSPGAIAPPERRFVQRHLVQPLIQWMPLGGSGWLLLRFLLQQDWVLVLLAFPVTVVTAVWAAYSQHFVERLAEIYGARGKQDADALTQWLDSLNEAVKWQLSGFDQHYLKLQGNLCQDYTTEGFNPDRTAIPMLEEVFVPLQLSGYFAGEEAFVASGDRPAEGLSIWDLIIRSRKDPTFRQIAIQAQGGFGKTTLLRHVALIYGQGKQHRYHAPKLMPFLLYLRDWRDLLAKPQLPTLVELIAQHYLPQLFHGKPFHLPPRWVETVLLYGRSAPALIMLDGFDELAEGQRQQVSHWISEQMKVYDRATFILTSRPSGFRDYVAKRPSTPVFVRKFTAQQQTDFIRQWYFCQERCFRAEKYAKQAREIAERKASELIAQLQDPDRQDLREMAENPLLLNMLATFHRFDPGVELPKRRIDLYQGICKLQLEDRPQARGIPMLLPLRKSQSVLQSLALAMVQRNHPTVSHPTLLTFLQNHPILKEEQIEAEAFLKQMIQVSELLVERESRQYEFPHLSFQGYFAACCLLRYNHGTALKLVQENWHQAWWRETILLYTAQLSPRLITQVIQAACIGRREAAQLAYDCLREYRNPEKLDPALESELQMLTGTVQGLRYQALDDYLRQGLWKAADRETYRLMINTVGKEEGQWFEPEELLNFPCEELRAIDRLWVKYSNGKFGFSVQKKLYLECGATLDGKYPGDKIWYEFFDRAQWRANNSSSVVSFDTTSPVGHLPVCEWVILEGGWLAFSALITRLAKCKL